MTGDRAVSTLADAAAFLLLVSIAVGTLAHPAVAPDRAPPAGASAERLSTVTANPNYSLAPGARAANESLVTFEQTEGPEFDRVAHGSVASLLADAAVGNATVGGRELTRTGDGFERAVRGAARDATTRRVRVRAVWTPYSGAAVRGVVAVGPRPPPDARVGVTTLAVDSGVPAARERARSAARTDGYEGVARVVARATVRGLFPPGELRLALRDDYPVSALARYRYLRAGRLLDADIRGPVRGVEPGRANERLSRALAVRIERDVRDRYETPAAAARAVRTGEVRIVVRRWEDG
ncbi:MAG: hypothetical protein V5A62_08380 [Haloarculaceae archaeon]